MIMFLALGKVIRTNILLHGIYNGKFCEGKKILQIIQRNEFGFQKKLNLRIVFFFPGIFLLLTLNFTFAHPLREEVAYKSHIFVKVKINFVSDKCWCK